MRSMDQEFEQADIQLKKDQKPKGRRKLRARNNSRQFRHDGLHTVQKQASQKSTQVQRTVQTMQTQLFPALCPGSIEGSSSLHTSLPLYLTIWPSVLLSILIQLHLIQFFKLMLMVQDVLADMGMGTFGKLKILEGLIFDVFSTIVLSSGKSPACWNEVFAISGVQDFWQASVKTLVKEAFVTTLPGLFIAIY